MSTIPPGIRPPSLEDVHEYAEKHSMDLTEDEAEILQKNMVVYQEEIAQLDNLQEPKPPRASTTTRDLGYRPDDDEDPLNAFVTKCDVSKTEDGLLSDYEIGVKDSIAVAGVEMTVGSKMMEGYVPLYDSTVITRLLDAGGTITGKMNMSEFGCEAAGEFSNSGRILNPRDNNYLAGGSSGGSAAAVVSEDVDVTLGGDQAGSIRVPAAWCGAIGLKPTHGLVPYTGSVGWGHTFDHLGPIGTSVEDVAKILDVIAGKDPLDPRQGIVKTEEYASSLSEEVNDLKIGVLEEGFDYDASESQVDSSVRNAVKRLEELGASVESVSIPQHYNGLPIWLGTWIGETTTLWKTDGVGSLGKGFYSTQFAEFFGAKRRTRADDHAIAVKLALIMGEYVQDKYMSRYHAKAQNLRRSLKESFDEKFEKFDALAMPTTPQTAHEVKENVSHEEALERGWNQLQNTPTFNMTGHPALTLPCGTSDGLPIGLQLVGEEFDDSTLLRIAYAFEQNTDWESM